MAEKQSRKLKDPESQKQLADAKVYFGANTLLVNPLFSRSVSVSSGVLFKIKSAPILNNSSSSPKPHNTPTVCAPADLPARISTVVSPIIRHSSGLTPIF